MKSLNDIRDYIQTFSAHAHSEEENIDRVLDLCGALLEQLKTLRYHVDNLNGSKGEFVVRLGRLESVSHEPVAIPLAEMQERIKELARFIQNNGDAIVVYRDQLTERVDSLARARDAINGTIKVHNDHLQAHNTDILRLMNDRVELRDKFAMAALTGILAHRGVVAPTHPIGEVADLVEDAYNVADAMLAIRGEKPAFQDNAIHQKENQHVNNTINGQPKSITIEFAEDSKVEQTHGYDLDGAKETPIEESYGGTDPE